MKNKHTKSSFHSFAEDKLENRKMAATDVQGSVDQAIGEIDQEVEALEQEGKGMESLSQETEAAIEMLSTGVLSAFLPEMGDMKERIRELT